MLLRYLFSTTETKGVPLEWILFGFFFYHSISHSIEVCSEWVWYEIMMKLRNFAKKKNKISLKTSNRKLNTCLKTCFFLFFVSKKHLYKIFNISYVLWYYQTCDPCHFWLRTNCRNAWILRTISHYKHLLRTFWNMWHA